jgi:hypothetical protein
VFPWQQQHHQCRYSIQFSSHTQHRQSKRIIFKDSKDMKGVISRFNGYFDDDPLFKWKKGTCTAHTVYLNSLCHLTTTKKMNKMMMIISN